MMSPFQPQIPVNYLNPINQSPIRTMTRDNTIGLMNNDNKKENVLKEEKSIEKKIQGLKREARYLRKIHHRGRTLAKKGGKGGGGSSNEPTIINIPIPRDDNTQVEYVHIFPDDSPMTRGFNQWGNPGPYSNYSPYDYYMPSYSIKTMTNGEEKVNNYFGYNPGR